MTLTRSAEHAWCLHIQIAPLRYAPRFSKLRLSGWLPAARPDRILLTGTATREGPRIKGNKNVCRDKHTARQPSARATSTAHIITQSNYTSFLQVVSMTDVLMSRSMAELMNISSFGIMGTAMYRIFFRSSKRPAKLLYLHQIQYTGILR